MVIGELTVETEVVVIGGGPGGYVAAIRAAQLGREVTLIEQEKPLGGVCLNEGCIPTKALIHASNYFENIKHMAETGVLIKDYAVDIARMVGWKEGIISKLEGGIDGLCQKHGIERIWGRAAFIDSHKLRIEGKTDIREVKFKHAIIATGSSIIQVPGFEFDGEIVIGSKEALSLKQVPHKMIIIGGGYIGTELGTVYGKLGTEVHILEMQDRLLAGMEADLVEVITHKLKQFNITPHCKTKAVSLEKKDGRAFVTYEENGQRATMDADKVLVVVGRKPNTKDIGLENTKVAVDAKGFIVVDEKMRTSEPHIYAVGDVAGQPMLAHKASRQGKIAAEVISGEPSAYDNKVVPLVVFNDPEVISVGITEDEAKKKGIEVVVGKFPFSALGRAMTLMEPTGFVKVVARKDNQVILGMHAVGVNASDVVSEAALAIEMGATLEDVASTIHPHPTMTEGFMESAEAALGKAIHIFMPKK